MIVPEDDLVCTHMLTGRGGCFDLETPQAIDTCVSEDGDLGKSFGFHDGSDMVSMFGDDVGREVEEPRMDVKVDFEPNDGDKVFSPGLGHKCAGDGVLDGHEAAETVCKFRQLEDALGCCWKRHIGC